MTNLKIMTLNMKNRVLLSEFERRSGSIIAMVRWHDPDLIGVQELTEEMIPAISQLADTYAFYGKARGSMPPANERCCILYKKDRFRFENGETFWLSDTPEKPGSSVPLTMFPRIMTWGRLTDLVSHQTLTFANTHLDHILPSARLKQVDIIIRRLKEKVKDDILIITGDFNASSLSLALHRLSEDPDLNIRDTVPTDGVTTIRNFLQASSSQFRPIDHIFVSRQIQVLKSEIITGMYMGRYPSDHCPVLTVVELPQAATAEETPADSESQPQNSQ